MRDKSGVGCVGFARVEQSFEASSGTVEVGDGTKL